jgi:Flp pilus assembly protein TadG
VQIRFLPKHSCLLLSEILLVLHSMVRVTHRKISPPFRRRDGALPAIGRSRAGVIVLEAIVVTTLLVILTLAILQWSILMITHQGVTAAASEGARTAARSVFANSQQLDTEATVSAVLAAHGVSSVGTTVSIVDHTTYITVQVTVPFTSTSIPELLASFGIPMSSRSLQVMAAGWKT